MSTAGLEKVPARVSTKWHRTRDDKGRQFRQCHPSAESEKVSVSEKSCCKLRFLLK